MNRALRRRHRTMIVVVGTLVATLAILGLLARRQMPTVPSLDVLDERPAAAEPAVADR